LKEGEEPESPTHNQGNTITRVKQSSSKDIEEPSTESKGEIDEEYMPSVKK
jgi:hypothetical protein